MNCKKKEKKVLLEETIFLDTTSIDLNKKSLSSEINLSDFFIKDELKDLSNTTWVSLEFVQDFYDPNYNSKNRKKDFYDYPYMCIYLKNWQSGLVYSDSQKLDYRKLDLKLINDSLYYVTNKNKHHYKNQKDSLFISKNDNVINFICKKDTIKKYL